MPLTSEPAALKNVKGWIIDMDGVLYRDTEPIPGAAEFIAALQEDQTPYVLLTNNSTLTPGQYVAKLRPMGIAVTEDRVLTSALATADYLEEVAAPGARVYILGTDGIRQAVRDSRLTPTDDYREADFVVVGLDRHLTFMQLQDASLAIRRGAQFIGTNPDRTLPTPLGEIPGNGAILAAIEAATDVEPIIIGKPRRRIFDWARGHLGLSAPEVACLGDRLETDILGGHDAGLFTVFVRSGVSTAEDRDRFDPKPDAEFDGPLDLLAAWKRRQS